jgi:hypothetical protein
MFLAVLLAGLMTGCASLTGGALPVPDDIVLRSAHVEYQWYGEGPSHGYTFDVTCKESDCNASAECTRTIESDRGVAVHTDIIPVDANLLQSLDVIFVGAEAVAEPREVIEHTDDYPRYTITLLTEHDETMVISSSSNTRKHTPWNLKWNGQWYVQESEAFADAYLALFAAVQPDTCAG